MHIKVTSTPASIQKLKTNYWTMTVSQKDNDVKAHYLCRKIKVINLVPSCNITAFVVWKLTSQIYEKQTVYIKFRHFFFFWLGQRCGYLQWHTFRKKTRSYLSFSSPQILYVYSAYCPPCAKTLVTSQFSEKTFKSLYAMHYYLRQRYQSSYFL